jgi:hypothetical protein
MPYRGQRVVNPNDEPLVVTPMTTAGPQPWHAEALKLRKKEWYVREIAEHLGKGFGSVQRFLNQESKRRQKIRQAEYEKKRRVEDPEYDARMRDYNRRFMQHQAPKRWAKREQLR